MNENQKSPKDTARTEVSLWGIAGLLLRKIHWLIVAGLVLGVGVYLVLSLLVTPTYESRVTFYVYNNSGGASRPDRSTRATYKQQKVLQQPIQKYWRAILF